MSSRSLQSASYHKLLDGQTFGPGALNSLGVPMEGAGGVTFIVAIGSAAAGDVTLTLRESDDGVSYSNLVSTSTPQVSVAGGGILIVRCVAPRLPFIGLEIGCLASMPIDSVIGIRHGLSKPPGVSESLAEFNYHAPE